MTRVGFNRKSSRNRFIFLPRRLKKIFTAHCLLNLAAYFVIVAQIFDCDVGASANFFDGHLRLDTPQSLLFSQFIASHKTFYLHVARNENSPNLVKKMFPARLEKQRHFQNGKSYATIRAVDEKIACFVEQDWVRDGINPVALFGLIENNFADKSPIEFAVVLDDAVAEVTDVSVKKFAAWF